jgi:hypothetical protein
VLSSLTYEALPPERQRHPALPVGGPQPAKSETESIRP